MDDSLTLPGPPPEGLTVECHGEGVRIIVPDTRPGRWLPVWLLGAGICFYAILAVTLLGPWLAHLASGSGGVKALLNGISLLYNGVFLSWLCLRLGWSRDELTLRGNEISIRRHTGPFASKPYTIAAGAARIVPFNQWLWKVSESAVILSAGEKQVELTRIASPAQQKWLISVLESLAPEGPPLLPAAAKMARWRVQPLPDGGTRFVVRRETMPAELEELPRWVSDVPVPREWRVGPNRLLLIHRRFGRERVECLTDGQLGIEVQRRPYGDFHDLLVCVGGRARRLLTVRGLEAEGLRELASLLAQQTGWPLEVPVELGGKGTSDGESPP